MPNRYSDRPYTVGKGKPPVHTQFSKDRPGNRKGRPKGSSNSDTLLKRALEARVVVKEGGKERKISKHDAMVTQLVNKAASGDLRAIEQVMRLYREIEARAEPEVQSRPLSDADRAVLERFADRLRGDGGERS
jgi:hypothetical protein